MRQPPSLVAHVCQVLLLVMLSPLAGLYAFVIRLRNFAYDRKILPSFSGHSPRAGRRIPVISIGNLTAGGTGKTPLTALLVETWLKQGRRVGVMSRGYGGTRKGVVKVINDSNRERARIYGDEPTWLAARFPEVPVYVGVDRVQVAKELLENESVDMLVADDAFQHRRLQRDLDFVLIDATEPRWHYSSLPAGRMREGFASLKRANVVFLNKVNLAEPEYVEWLRQVIQKNVRTSTPIIEMESVIGGYSLLNSPGQGHVPGSGLKGKRLLLVSGIGRPATFSQLVSLASQADIVEHLIYRDHHPYSEEDLRLIEAKGNDLGIDALVITEKDAVKLMNWKPKVSWPCYVSHLVNQPKSDRGAFYEAIDRLLL